MIDVTAEVDRSKFGMDKPEPTLLDLDGFKLFMNNVFPEFSRSNMQVIDDVPLILESGRGLSAVASQERTYCARADYSGFGANPGYRRTQTPEGSRKKSNIL